MGTTGKLNKISTYELLDMVNRHYRYSNEFIILVLKELDNRKVTNQRIEELKAKLKKQGTWKNFLQESKNAEQSGKLQLYQPQSIFLFALLFSTFFASILMAINLKVLGKIKEMYHALFFGLLYSVTVSSVAQKLMEVGPLAVIILNALGAYILTYYFWRPAVANTDEYEKRPITIPLIIGLLATLPLLYLLSRQGIIF